MTCFAAILLLFAQFLLTCQAATCYYHDGTDAINNIVCPGSQTCCGPTASCISNRLCHNSGDPDDVFIRGPCAVNPYNSDTCGDICAFNETGGRFPRATQCEDGSWCCNPDPDVLTCCQNGGSGVWLGTLGDAVTVSPTSSYMYSTVYVGDISKTTTSTSSSTASSTTSTPVSSSATPTSSSETLPTSTASPSPTSSPSSGLSSGAKAGIGAGVGVGGAAVVSILTLAWVIHKRRVRKNTDEVNSLQQLNGGNNYDAQGHNSGSRYSDDKPNDFTSSIAAGNINYQRPSAYHEASGESELRELSGEQRVMELQGSSPEDRSDKLHK